MESFTLLKFWRRSTSPSAPPSHHPITTLLASADTEDGLPDGTDAEEDDDGSFFDLQLDLSDEEDDDDKALHPVDNAEASSASEGDDEREEGGDGTDSIDRGLNFVISPRSVNDASDDSGIFFKGDIFPILPSSDNATSPKPAHSPVSLLKSSAKLRVLISGLKKPAAQEKSEKGRTGSERRKNRRRLFIKFKVEEKPFASLFTRDNSSKISSANKHDARQASDELDIASAEDRGLSREAKMQRYLKKVKPLYVGVAKLRPSSQLRSAVETHKVAHDVNGGGSSDAEPGRGNEGEPGAGIKVGFGVMCRQLGKSRSASSAVAAAPSPSAASSRRDDSLLQQQDGIQGAILHCKRSFNESRDSDVNGLGRYASNSSHMIATESMVESSRRSNLTPEKRTDEFAKFASL